MSKILTVIIPSYNVEKYLRNSLESYISDYLEEKLEVLIVNDGSKDRTAEIAKEYENKYPKLFKLINKENGGHGSTLNVGKQYATGKYTRVIDGDDWVDTRLLEKLVHKIEDTQTDIDVILTPHTRVYEGSNRKEVIENDKLISGKTYKIVDILDKIERIYQLHGICIKTEILNKIPSITENCFYVDQQYVVYPLKYVRELLYLNIPSYQYRIGIGEQSMSMKSQQKNRKMLIKVSETLIDYTKEIDNEKIKDFINLKVAKLYSRIIRIFLSFGPKKEYLEEYKSFSKIIQENKQVKKKLDKISIKILKGNDLIYYMYATIYCLKLKVQRKK